MKYEILKEFTDKYDSSILYEVGKTYTFSDERVEEIKSKEKEIGYKLIKKAKTKKVEVE